MNFGKYPVLRIDLADTDDYGLKGCRVRIDAGTFRNGEPYIIDAELRVYRDEKKLTTFSSGACLHDSFGYYDYVKMTENAMAPLIRPDEDVVVAVYDSKKERPYAAMIVHTAKHVSRGCISPLEFDDADMTPYVRVAGIFD
jgi:hypothetical protein